VSRLALAVAAALAVSAGGCRPGDREIREQYTAIFDAPPVAAIRPCPDADAKLERLQPLFDLTLRAYKTITKFSTPLPDDLAADLMATPIAGLAADYRCVIGDGSDRSVVLGTIVNLYLRKGEALLTAGQTDAGYAHVIEGLSVYTHAPAFEFIHYLGAGYVLERIQTLLEKYPAPDAVLERLLQTAEDSLLPRATFCAGIKAEFVMQSYQVFYDRLGPLRARATARWGERATKLFDEVAKNKRHGDLAVWRLTRDLYVPLIDGCLDGHTPLMSLEKAARAKLATAPKNATFALWAPYTLDRLEQFGKLEDAFLLFMIDVMRRRQALHGLRTDAQNDLYLVFLPVVNDWNGSTAGVKDDPDHPGGVVVSRGEFTRSLPPLAPRR